MWIGLVSAIACSTNFFFGVFTPRDSIVSSASFLANAPAASGSILAVFGQNFGMTNNDGLFPSTQFELEGVSVLFDDTAAPLFGVFGKVFACC